MVKMAVFCPRLPQETECAWKTRRHACRLYLSQFPNVEAVEFDTLEQLQAHYPRHGFRRVLVAQQSYYPQAFWQWKTYQRVDVLDVVAQSGSALIAALRERVQEVIAGEARIEARFA
jgi:hypothetical protein